MRDYNVRPTAWTLRTRLKISEVQGSLANSGMTQGAVL